MDKNWQEWPSFQHQSEDAWEGSGNLNEMGDGAAGGVTEAFVVENTSGTRE